MPLVLFDVTESGYNTSIVPAMKNRDQIKSIHRGLGISEDYEATSGLVLQPEEVDLIEIGSDMFGRPQRLSENAAQAWLAMQKHADEDDVVLDVVSAFRSVDKQVKIIQRKLNQGRPVSQILKACAAPGYSEHHTGRAIDINTPGCEPLSESFETTEAFNWLMKFARLYSFKLSYPKENNSVVLYEPWHWAYWPAPETK